MSLDDVRLGRNGLTISNIVIGCLGFGEPQRGTHGWSLPEDESRPLIRAALEAGATTFDTADLYSAGSSEEILGRALRDFAVREEVVVMTKVYERTRPGPNGAGLSRAHIMTAIDDSLRRLGTDYVDLYQIHRFDPLVPLEETMEALHDVVKSGKARYLGASSMFAWRFQKAQNVARRNGWTPFVSMQNHYNLLDREEEREMNPYCVDDGVGIIPWSPLARGRLALPAGAETERSGSDPFGDALYRGHDESDRRTIDEVGAVADEHGATRAQVALAWLRQQPGVTAPIVGVTARQHLVDAIASTDLRLSDEELARLGGHYTPRLPDAFLG
jgi:aryl-alcohol dehydrogenase-like predicted oxidoreductase